MLHTDGVNIDGLIAMRNALDDQIASRVADPVVTTTVTTPTKKSKKLEKTVRKAVEKDLRKQAKKAQAKKAKAKAKHKKASGKKGLKKVTTKVTKTTKKAGRKTKSGAKTVWSKTKSGARKVRRGVAKAGRKMWSWIVGGSGATWKAMKWAGRKLAGAVALTFGAGAKLVGWVLGGIGWGWAMIAVGGLVVLTLVSWAVGAATRPTITRTKWISKGRPGSYKKYKAAELKKRRAKAEARLTKAKAERQKRWDKAVDKGVKKALKKIEQEYPETVADSLPEFEAAEERDARLLEMATAGEYPEGTTIEDITEGLHLKMLAMKDAEVPKDAYGTIVGRWACADRIRKELEAEYVERGGLVLRGSSLYQALKKEVTASYGNVQQAGRAIDWHSFSAAIDEELARLDSFGLVTADAGV